MTTDMQKLSLLNLAGMVVRSILKMGQALSPAIFRQSCEVVRRINKNIDISVVSQTEWVTPRLP
jgi:hypothetical protein